MSFLDQFAPGDLLATRSPSCIGVAVRIMAGGQYDHLAIVAPHPRTGRLCVYEAWGLDPDVPCLVTRKKRPGFRCRPLPKWVRTAQDDGCEVYRVPLAKPLSITEAERLTDLLADWCRRPTPYDLVGAARVRKWGGRWATKWLVPCKDDAAELFCSESAARADQHLGRIKLDNPAAWAPSPYLREARRQGARLAPILIPPREE